MASCSKTFTCQGSIYRHVTQCHSTADIVAQINQRQKRSNNRQYSIPSLLSGFNRQKLNQDNELAQQMKQLLDLLLNDESLVKVPDEEVMEIGLGDSSLDPTLRDGYKEIGLTEL